MKFIIEQAAQLHFTLRFGRVGRRPTLRVGALGRGGFALVSCQSKNPPRSFLAANMKSVSNKFHVQLHRVRMACSSILRRALRRCFGCTQQRKQCWNVNGLGKMLMKSSCQRSLDIFLLSVTRQGEELAIS